MNDGLFNSLRAESLQWLPKLGIGWYPVTAQPYGREYWDNYRHLDSTPSGDALTKMRIALVAKYWDGEVIDIGIGGGRFVSERPKTCGFDVNMYAVDWLKSLALFRDLYQSQIDAATFWDSFEHIHDPRPLLKNIRKWVFTSLPIFTSAADALRSKHFKPTEHCWYFTAEGIVELMGMHGFDCVEHNIMEQAAGREQIDTFVFHRC